MAEYSSSVAEPAVSKSDESLLQLARDRFDKVVEFESENRQEMLDDLRFESGQQWPQGLLRDREQDPDGPRPCLTVNKARAFKRLLVNDIRQNRPQIKILPVDDQGDVKTAEMLNELIRHIQATTDADIAYDTAVDNQVGIGVGYFRLITRLVDEASNLQEIAFSPIKNAFSVYMDYEAEDQAGADADWAFVIQEYDRDTFKREWPDAAAVDWDQVSANTNLSKWYPSEDVMIVAEYWTRSDDGTVTWHKMTGTEVLERVTYPSKWIGIIRVVGEERIVDGQRDYRGHIRDLKDPGRMYNYWVSANTEKTALGSKAPVQGPAEAFEGYEEQWAGMNQSNVPYIPYNQFDAQGNEIREPRRMDPVGQDTAMVGLMLQANDDLKSVANQYDASLGNRSNETSGIAIRARKVESDTANFHYVDNLTRSIRHAGRILLDMIPRVYDTRRVLRVLGEDETPGEAIIDPAAETPYAEVETLAGEVQKLYNPTIGRYDVIVTAGPSFSTKREEALEHMVAMSQANPNLWGVMGDLIVRAMDWPGADEMAERLKAALPPEIRQIADARNDGQAAGQAQAAAMMEQLRAQMAPMVEELEMALAAAEQSAQEKDAQIAELETALEDKTVEHQLKAAEIQAKAQAEAADNETELMIAALQYSGESPEGEGNGEDRNVVDHPALANVTAAQAAQQASASMAVLGEGLMEQLAEAQALIAGVREAAGAMGAEMDEIRGQMAADRNDRERIKGAVLAYLANPDDDAYRNVVDAARGN